MSSSLSHNCENLTTAVQMQSLCAAIGSKQYPVNLPVSIVYFINPREKTNSHIGSSSGGLSP